MDKQRNAIPFLVDGKPQECIGFGDLGSETHNGCTSAANTIAFIKVYAENIFVQADLQELENYGIVTRRIYAFNYKERSTIDNDGDGLPDVFEYANFPDLAQGPNDDPDGDGLSNIQEYIQFTNPTNADTDGDNCGQANNGPTDGNEANGLNTVPPNTITNPRDPLSFPSQYLDGAGLPVSVDFNSNGIPDCWELIYFPGLLAAGEENNDGEFKKIVFV